MPAQILVLSAMGAWCSGRAPKHIECTDTNAASQSPIDRLNTVADLSGSAPELDAKSSYNSPIILLFMIRPSQPPERVLSYQRKKNRNKL